MKKLLIIALIVGIFAAGAVVIQITTNMGTVSPKPILPPGYRVACSVDGKKHALWFPDKKRIGSNVWDSEEKAIRFAIYWEKVKDEPYIRESDKYEWVDCKEGG